MRLKILILEDEGAQRDLHNALDATHDAVWTPSIRRAIDALGSHKFDIID